MIKRPTPTIASPRRMVLVFVLIGMGLIGGTAYFNRTPIRDGFTRMMAPRLPTEEAYQPTSPRPPVGSPSSTPEKPPSDPTPVPAKDPVEPAPVSLPTEKRLAVPFTSQAPHAHWDEVHEETCEEASVLMVQEYYKGRTGVIPKDEAEDKLQAIIAFENALLGFNEDTTAQQTAELIEAMDPELEATVVPFKDAQQIKQFIAQGTPVIIPANGKTLPNPNFRNGGPPYHMLVVRGYTADHFITNDPGTRLGENFLYTHDGLTDAIHDWNGGDVPNGARVILVVTAKR